MSRRTLVSTLYSRPVRSKVTVPYLHYEYAEERLRTRCCPETSEPCPGRWYQMALSAVRGPRLEHAHFRRLRQRLYQNLGREAPLEM